MNKLYDAITEIQDEYILDAETASMKQHYFRWKPVVAAFLVVILLALPVSAELVNGYVSNLLAPLYGGAQTEIVDKIGVPIGAEAIVGDYKVTADAVIGDKYNFAIVYSLSRSDGQPLEEGLYFESYSNSFRSDSGAGVLRHTLSEDGLSLKIVDEWTSRLMFLDRNVKVQFSNLVKYQGEGQNNEIVLKGNWNLEFVIRYEDATQEIPIEPFTVKDASGDQYEIRKIEISPVGIHFDMTAPNNYNEEEVVPPPYQDFTLAIELSDGTIIRIEDQSMGSHGDLNSNTLEADYGALFELPIALEDIAALIICDVTLPINKGIG